MPTDYTQASMKSSFVIIPITNKEPLKLILLVVAITICLWNTCNNKEDSFLWNTFWLYLCQQPLVWSTINFRNTIFEDMNNNSSFFLNNQSQLLITNHMKCTALSLWRDEYTNTYVSHFFEPLVYCISFQPE